MRMGQYICPGVQKGMEWQAQRQPGCHCLGGCRHDLVVLCIRYSPVRMFGGGGGGAGFQGSFSHLPVYALMYLSSEDLREDSFHARWVPTHSSY